MLKCLPGTGLNVVKSEKLIVKLVQLDMARLYKTVLMASRVLSFPDWSPKFESIT